MKCKYILSFIIILIFLTMFGMQPLSQDIKDLSDTDQIGSGIQSLSQNIDYLGGDIQTLSMDTGYLMEINQRSKQLPILMYHSVNDKPVGLTELSVKKRGFEDQVKYLSDNGYTGLSFEDLENFDGFKKPVIITFDDGYKDNYYNAYPILKKYNMKATIFVITNNIDKPGFLTKTHIIEMSDLISFQSHTHNHISMDKSGLNELKRECEQSQNKLYGITKKPVIAISYPFGAYNQTAISAVSSYYKYAITTHSGYYNLNNDNYSINRIRLERSNNLDYFISMVNPDKIS